MIFLELSRWKRLFNVYAYKDWQSSKNDKRRGYTFYTVEDGTYLTMDVEDEVYIEEFKSGQEMRSFYGLEVNEQLTIFEVM
ncbi:hypothetical protein [Macrococcus animalis]|uniref:hypothetical protein n=1 Tax=Macrococcus animalis TaxID=3395467 RepID=UPI0039BDB522